MTRVLRNLTLAAVASAAVGCGLLPGQTDEPSAPNLQASAYYHATLGHMYS